MYVRLALWNRPLLQSLSWNMTYSTGLAFAVAAHLEPEILLVDEVLAVGDAAFQKKCVGKMAVGRRKGRRGTV
jgi:ABC-type polysaccharide/polyol phosphate transport system ATPase subunit